MFHFSEPSTKRKLCSIGKPDEKCGTNKNPIFSLFSNNIFFSVNVFLKQN